MEAPGLGKFTYEAERKKVTLSMLVAVSKLFVISAVAALGGRGSG